MLSETTKRWVVIGSVLILTLWLAWRAPEVEDDNDLVVASETLRTRQVETGTVKKNANNNFRLHPRKMIDSQSIDIFATHAKVRIIKPKPVIKVKSTHLKPTVPKLPFKYIGQLVENKKTKIFLMRGQALHVVTQGDNIGKDYQLVQVKKDKIKLLYLPLNITQTVNIGKTP